MQLEPDHKPIIMPNTISISSIELKLPFYILEQVVEKN